MADQQLKHLVQAGVAEGSLAATLNTLTEARWKVLTILYAAGTYTIVCQRIEPFTFSS